MFSPIVVCAPLALALPFGAQVGPSSGLDTGPPAMRYQIEAQGGNRGVPRSVAIGDDGALVIAGRSWSDSGLDFFWTGSPEPLAEIRFEARANFVAVAAAEHAPYAAALTLIDVDPDPDVYMHEPAVRFFTTDGKVEEQWTWPFPQEFPWYDMGGGVEVSDDGRVVLGWWDSHTRSVKHVVALSREGDVITELELPMFGTGTYAGGAKLSADGTRAVVATHHDATLVDLVQGTVLHDYTAPAHHMTGIGISGDGQRFATSALRELHVWEEVAPGTWVSRLQRTQPGLDDFGTADVSADGRRLGYAVERAGHFEFDTVLVDIDTGVELFRSTVVEPDAYDPVRAHDIELDHDGDVVAVASFGDYLESTPEALVYDDTGALLSTHDLVGSAFVVDLDARGEVLAFGSSSRWGIAYEGGEITVADPRPPSLRITGEPRFRYALDVTVAGELGHGRAVLSVSKSGAMFSTPFGSSGLGRGRAHVVTLPLTGGVAKHTLEIRDPSLVGLLLHFQGTLLGRNEPTLTNTVSVRIGF